MEDAVNARGLAIGLTSVYTPRPRPGLNAGMVLRLLAETCAAVPEALDRLRALPLASCQTLTLADAAGDIAVAECSPEGMRVERPGPAGPFVCAANLFHSDLAVPLPPGLDSWRAAERYDTMRRVLEREGETLALSGVQALLAGRKGFLCQYDRAAGRDTVWSAACDLTRRRCLLAEGNPGRTAFREIPFPVERGDSRP